MKFLEFLGFVKQVPMQLSFVRSMAIRYVITSLSLRRIFVKTHALDAKGNIALIQKRNAHCLREGASRSAAVPPRHSFQHQNFKLHSILTRPLPSTAKLFFGTLSVSSPDFSVAFSLFMSTSTGKLKCRRKGPTFRSATTSTNFGD
jgi:hypothetical protein